MHALRFHQFGDLKNLQLEQIGDPVVSPDEVLIQVRAASINPSDVKNVQGRMQGTTLPRTPGRDFAGVVVDGPPHLRGVEVWGSGGDAGFTRDGSHAEFMVIPAAAAVAKPAALSFEQAACVGVNFVTAYEGLIARARIQTDEILLVTGARGGVGNAALQLGQAAGAKVIAVDRKPLNAAFFEGVDLLGYLESDVPDLNSEVRRLTGGRGVDVAFDCVGGEMFEPVLSTLTDRGRQIAITSVGQRRVSFDMLDFYHRSLTLLGVDSRSLTVTDCANLLDKMSGFFAAGLLKPSRISRHGSLANALELYSYVDQGGGGKAVFVFEGGLSD
ncbi:MAG TPA: zinc-binding alcohol dehydrogenase family protein [Acidobacteriaceae bacterium]|nr:zinc-binding alcohol dehydrogenase family protein [Acidobacteriaceae bacterium]